MSYHKAVIAVALTAFLATFFWMFRKCGTDPLGTSFGTSFGMSTAPYTKSDTQSKQKIDGGSQTTKWEGVHTCLLHEEDRVPGREAFTRHARKQAAGHVFVVLFAYLDDKGNFVNIAKDNTRMLKGTGLCNNPSNCTLTVEVATHDTAMFNQAAEIVKAAFPSAFVDQHCSNDFEYPGIRKIWDIGQAVNDGLILYWHNDGVNHGYPLDDTPKALFYVVISQWQKILDLYRTNANLSTVGFSNTCHDGQLGGTFQWFNFYWVAAKYARTLEKPLLTHRRHYYEEYVGRVRADARESDVTCASRHIGLACARGETVLAYDTLHRMTQVISWGRNLCAEEWNAASPMLCDRFYQAMMDVSTCQGLAPK